MHSARPVPDNPRSSLHPWLLPCPRALERLLGEPRTGTDAMAPPLPQTTMAACARVFRRALRQGRLVLRSTGHDRRPCPPRRGRTPATDTCLHDFAQCVAAALDRDPDPLRPSARSRRAKLQRCLAEAERAMDTLAQRNARLVADRARRFALRSGRPFEELLNEGWFGLRRAIEKFEPERNLAFSTYAVLWIDQAIVRHLKTTEDLIRVPLHVRDRVRREGTDDPLGAVVSLDESDEDGRERLVVADDEPADPEGDIDRRHLADRLRIAIADLPARERLALATCPELDLLPLAGHRPSRAVLAETLGISRERLRQLRQAALARLAADARIRPLRALLA